MIRRCGAEGCSVRLRPGNKTTRCFRHGGTPPERIDGAPGSARPGADGGGGAVAERPCGFPTSYGHPCRRAVVRGEEICPQHLGRDPAGTRVTRPPAERVRCGAPIWSGEPCRSFLNAAGAYQFHGPRQAAPEPVP
jgi:hypothetical protein